MKKISRRTFLKLAAAGGLLASYPTLIERHLVEINHYQIPLPRLPRAFENFTIVQLTDIHYRHYLSLRFIRHLIQKAVDIRGDIIVCTGDYGHKEDAADIIFSELSRLDARLGVYSILGNHDNWEYPEAALKWLDKTGQNLRYKQKYFERDGERLWIVGAGDLWTEHKSIDKLLVKIPEKDFRIVLAHNPDSADTSFRKKVDLFVCGHTHGGQVVVPFYGPPVLPVYNKSYSVGLKRSLRGEPVFISKGIGSSIIPVRFNCIPEIAVLKLVRA